MATIKFDNVQKIYPNHVQAVFDFTLDVKEKEFIVFVGPSGCGKSTTLRMLAGLEEITDGTISINDNVINTVPPKDRDIAMVFQNYALYPHMSVYENMAFSLKLRKDYFPLTEVDYQNPEYQKELEEIENKYKIDLKEGIEKINSQKVKKGRKTKKEKIKEFKFKLKNEYNVSVENLINKYSKPIYTYDNDKVKELNLKIKELRSQNPVNEEEINKVLKEIETIKADLSVPAKEYRHLTSREIAKKINSAAKTLGLEPYLKRKPAALSGGQRQRVALGRAIVRNPKVFLMDEPLSNLDAKLRVQMRSEIAKIHKLVGATTIYVTHDQTEAMTMATRIVCMKDGHIQQIGTPKELFNTPCNMFVAGFIGSPAMNFIHGKFNGKDFISRDETITIKLSEKEQTLLKNYSEKEVILGVRPEDIYVHEKNMIITNPSNSFELTCDISELLGRELIIYSNIGKDKIIIKSNRKDDITSGMVEKYALDMDRVLFFDPNTTNRIVEK